jgi:hypothetical protein
MALRETLLHLGRRVPVLSNLAVFNTERCQLTGRSVGCQEAADGFVLARIIWVVEGSARKRCRGMGAD